MPIQHLPGKSIVTVVMVIRPEAAPDEAGEVFLELGPEHRVKLKLDRRFFRLFRILIEAALFDRDLILDVKGLRSTSTIARRYAEQAAEVVPLSGSAVKTYVKAIRAAFAEAFEELLAQAKVSPPPLKPQVIVTIRGGGYFIGDVQVTFIDHTDKE